MSSPKCPRRAGPARARALAEKDARDATVSSSAWLNGAHEAIALHPHWLQLRSHLQKLIAVAVRKRLDDEDNNMNPHAIEAIRQVAGNLFANNSATLPGPAKPHLLHEPYMSAAGAAGLRGQTLKDLAREVDIQAEAVNTLNSPEFRAFHDLTRSVYVGSLQKRADQVEKMRSSSTRQNQQYLDQCSVSPATLQKQQKCSRAANNDHRSTTTKLSEAMGGSFTKAGVESSSSQDCSGDIAQALVAIVMGEGFDMLSAGDDSSKFSATEDRELGESSLNEASINFSTSKTGGMRVAEMGKTSLSLHDGNGDSNNSSLWRRTRRPELPGEAALRYLSEDASTRVTASTTKSPGVTASTSTAKDEGGKAAEVGGLGVARIPGLDWLAPHIVGRSIPMTLRRELWRRKLAEHGTSAVEVGRMVARLAGEKGIVDPTNTPIAGMVATGVRHRAAEAFPWLARGGQAELELRQRACRVAEQLLNQYFVFVGRHEARHVAMSLVLAYVFDRGEGGGGDEEGGKGGGALVAMLHSLSSTCFAPGIADLCSDFRGRAYEEIRRRDAPLFAHLSAAFPAYKYGSEGEQEDNADVEAGGKGDGSPHPRGLVESWLEDALVGYLREDALLFVWDHLFLLGWAEQLPLFVADVAIHLRTVLLRAAAPLTLMSLARDACRKICTRDVREAFRRRHAASAVAAKSDF